jgi:hypothetical protein
MVHLGRTKHKDFQRWRTLGYEVDGGVYGISRPL